MSDIYLSREKSQVLLQRGVPENMASEIRDELDMTDGISNPKFKSYRLFTLFDLLKLAPDEIEDNVFVITKNQIGDKWFWIAGYNSIYWSVPCEHMIDAVADVVNWIYTKS